MLHKQLEKICSRYEASLMLKEHLKNLPELVIWMNAHCVINPYTFHVVKYNAIACYVVICNPDEH